MLGFLKRSMLTAMLVGAVATTVLAANSSILAEKDPDCINKCKAQAMTCRSGCLEIKDAEKRKKCMEGCSKGLAACKDRCPEKK